MNTQDPQRLADGEGSESLRKLLGAAEQDVLREESRGRVWAALAAAGVTTAAAATTVASGAKAGSSILAWLGSAKGMVASLVVLAAAGAGVGTWYASRPTAASAPASAALTASSRWAALLPPAPSPASSDAPAPQEDPAPAASSSAKRVVAASKPSSSAPATTTPAEPTPREGLLLLRARQALDSNPAQALELARQHEREFPASQLAPERAKLMREAQARIHP
ncbi:MAG: hypothetical protein HY898_25865 [Deltaproteobacteria bacterium]|nr:hypothetical protein [Deltaproteobacteria bacterium]